MKKEYRIGVIGMGMGINMLPVNKTEIPMKVTGICATNMEKLKSIQAENPDVEIITTDYMELCTSPDIDIIGVFSPDALHYEHCKAALENGKHC